MTAVYAQLPSAGLGNMLFVWAYATAFAKLNHGELFVSSWNRRQLGPILHLERSVWLHVGTFKGNNVPRILRLQWLKLSRRSIPNPVLETIEPASGPRHLYFYRAPCGDPKDPFRELIPYRQYLKESLEGSLSESTLARSVNLAAPTIGIHVRRGDFSRNGWAAPIEYFCERLASIRAVSGKTLPATVFSDGTSKELAPLLDMPEVSLSERQPDILDLLQLSRSKLMILSRGSTFGMWAGFLSHGVIIRDPVWNHGDSRPVETNQRFFEGGPDLDPKKWPALLLKNIDDLGIASGTFHNPNQGLQ